MSSRFLIDYTTDETSKFRQQEKIMTWGAGYASYGTVTEASSQGPLVSPRLTLISGSTNGAQYGLETSLGIPVDQQTGAARELLESGMINTPIRTSPTAIADDVLRMTKLLTTTRGLSWLTHMAENGKVSAESEAYWANKRDGGSDFNRWKQLGKSLVDGLYTTAKQTTSLLEQTAVTGLGIHTTPWLSNAYLKNIGDPGNNFSQVMNSIENLGDRKASDSISAVELAQAGKPIVYRVGHYDSKGNYVEHSGSAEIQGLTSGVNYQGPLDSEDSDYTNKIESLGNFGQVPFYFDIYTDLNKRKRLVFQANLNSYDDNYNGDWGSVQYVGRGEQFYNYNKFTREISFSFKAAARSKKDMSGLYAELNQLAASTAPNYNETGAFMRGTFVKVRVGDILPETWGFFKNVKLSIKEEYPWEVEDVQGMPHILDVSVSFIPIQENVVDSKDIQFFNYSGKDS